MCRPPDSVKGPGQCIAPWTVCCAVDSVECPEQCIRAWPWQCIGAMTARVSRSRGLAGCAAAHRSAIVGCMNLTRSFCCALFFVVLAAPRWWLFLAWPSSGLSAVLSRFCSGWDRSVGFPAVVTLSSSPFFFLRFRCLPLLASHLSTHSASSLVALGPWLQPLSGVPCS